MARPLLADHLLKNPRHIRRSTTVATILPEAPKPSKALLALWKGVIDMSINSILSQPSRENNKAKKLRVQIRFSVEWKAPKDFPVGKIVERGEGWLVRRFNPEDLVRWAYMYRLTPESPAMLYAKRQKHISNVTRLENECLKSVDSDYLSSYYEHLDSILLDIT